MNSALDDLRVIDLSRSFWSALAGTMLADFGADVIHVQPPAEGFVWEADLVPGAGWDYLAELAHRNKRGLAIRMDEESGAGLVERLFDQADVLLVDWPLEELAAQGWEAERLRVDRPELIVARGTGFGPEGPDRGLPADDVLAAARTGLMPTLPRPGRPPVFPESGPMYTAVMLAVGIMAAVHHRAESGRGQIVDASLLAGNMYGASLDLQAYLAIRGDAFLGPMAQADRGNPMSGTLYMTSDERWVTLTMPDTDRWWPGFASLIGVAADDPRFDDHEKRTAAHRSELMTVIDEAIRGRSASDWRAAFAERGLSADVIEEFDYPADDVEARRNRYILDLEDSSRGSFKTLGFPIFMSQTPARLDGRSPTRGQHTARILHDLLGLSESEIDALETQGTIRA
jgi:crotonobetainyl-CoA:carnitine CoA-transferase CaiB-like acyl-CoA transferase